MTDLADFEFSGAVSDNDRAMLPVFFARIGERQTDSLNTAPTRITPDFLPRGKHSCSLQLSSEFSRLAPIASTGIEARAGHSDRSILNEGVFAVAYTPGWESLSAAAERLMKASGCTQEQAQWDICRALADGAIGFRVNLAKHAIRPPRSSVLVYGHQLELPTSLTPKDIDWEDSRPTKPWHVRDLPRHHHGPWYLERIELSKADVTAKLLADLALTADPSAPETDKRPKRKQREPTQLKSADDAIRNLWKDIPPQRVLPNDLLDRDVNEWLKQHGRREVSRDTILRAAGRRK